MAIFVRKSHVKYASSFNSSQISPNMWLATSLSRIGLSSLCFQFPLERECHPHRSQSRHPLVWPSLLSLFSWLRGRSTYRWVRAGSYFGSCWYAGNYPPLISSPGTPQYTHRKIQYKFWISVPHQFSSSSRDIWTLLDIPLSGYYQFQCSNPTIFADAWKISYKTKQHFCTETQMMTISFLPHSGFY